MKSLILFLIRRRLGLKKYQQFRFTNQKENCVYFFGSGGLYKDYGRTPDEVIQVQLSGVSLNWLLDNDCKVEVVDKYV